MPFFPMNKGKKYLNWRKFCEKRRLCHTADTFPFQIIVQGKSLQRIDPFVQTLGYSSSTILKRLTASVHTVEQYSGKRGLMHL